MEIAHVHFYVEDAKLWRDWFVNYLGFKAVASGISSFHTCTEAVQNGVVYFLLSSPLSPTSPVAEFLRQHPPGVADIAFAVEDVEIAIAQAQAQGATILQPITEQQFGQTSLKCGKIAAWGGLTHTLIEKSFVSSETALREGFPPQATANPKGQWSIVNSQWQLTTDNTFTTIDHIVLNVAIGELELAVSWYKNILDFQPQQTFKIQTDRSALHSQVMISRNGKVQFPINEPASQ